MTLFDRNTIASRLNENSFAQAPSIGMGDRFSAEYKVFSEQQQFRSTHKAISDEYDRQIDIIEQATGKRLHNPRKLDIGKSLRNPLSLSSVQEQEEEYFKELEALGEVEGVSRSGEELRLKVGQERQADRDELDNTRERSRGLATGVAGFAGQAAGALTDPINLTTLALGAPLTSGIVRTALLEAGIGAGTEALIQAEVQTSRKQVGEEASLSEAVEAVAFAGGAGAVFGAAVKAIPQAYRALAGKGKNLKNPSSEVTSAIEDLEALAKAYEDSPSPRHAKNHLENIDEAVKAATEQRSPNLKEIPVSPTVPFRSEIKDLGRALAEHIDEGVANKVASDHGQVVFEAYNRQAKELVETLANADD